jgi:hypothetical protein
LGSGDPLIFQDYYGERPVQTIAHDFGPEFAEALTGAAPGEWQGPVKSGYGWHLVRVEAHDPGRVPAFEEVTAEVRTAWLGEMKAEAWGEAYEEMRARYNILLPVPTDEVLMPVSDPAGISDVAVRDP